MIARLLLVLLICSVPPNAKGYPGGAPISACTDLMPQHNTLPQSSPCPFELDLNAFQLESSFVYTPGFQYQLTLTAKDGNTSFKGFLVQARQLYLPYSVKVKGRFIDLPNNTQYLTCSGIDSSPYQGVVTHDNPMKKDFYSISLTWIAPSAGSGPLTFDFTVVQSYNVFWTLQVSEIIQEATNPYLLIANQRYVLRSDLDGKNQENVLTSERNALGANYHYRKNYMFWANGQDSGFGSIKRSYLDGSAITTIAESNLITPTTIAVDWINDKIYWSDENTSRIEVAELSGSHRKTLIATNLQHARGLVADPSTRHIFWVDYGTGIIERASMDGSDRKVIVSSGLLSPVSLTLDYSSQTLYWIDRDGTLESSLTDGTGRTLLLSANTVLFNTFGMAYYSNRLFWTERKEAAVYSSPVNDLHSYSLLISSLSFEPYQLQVVHPFSQPEAASPNPCAVDNGGCDQLCLLSATSPSGYSCACSDGFLPTDSSSAKCEEAPTYYMTLCLSGDVIVQEGCYNWIEDEPLKKLFRVGYDIVNGVNSICSCGLNSSNLLSVEYFSFTCYPTNPNAVNFTGYIYGNSLNTDISHLMDAYYQWVDATSPVDVFGTILYTNQCEQATSPPPISETQGLNLPVVLGVTLGSCAVVAIIFSCACLAFCFLHKRKQKQAQRQHREHAMNQREPSTQRVELQYTICHGQVTSSNDQQGSFSPPTYAEAEKLAYYQDGSVHYYNQQEGLGVEQEKTAYFQ